MNDKTSIRDFTIDSLKKFYANLNIPETGNSKIFYGTCNTAESEATKVVTCPAFTANDLVDGVMIIVNFANRNTNLTPYLKINDISATRYVIKKNTVGLIGNGGTTMSNTFNNGTKYQIGGACCFIFTGDYWFLANSDTSNTYYSMTQSDYENGESNTNVLISPAILKDAILYWMSKNQADWYEEDNESPTFIQNKPWYYTDNNVTSIVTDYPISTVDAIAIGNGSMAIGNTVYSVGDNSISTGDGETTNAYIYVEVGSTTITTYELTQTGFQLYGHNLHEGQTIIYKDEFYPITNIIDKYNFQVNRALNDESNIEYENIVVILGGMSFGTSSHSEGGVTSALGNYSHAEGYENMSRGNNSHTEGLENISEGNASHAEGQENISRGHNSHVEGQENISHGNSSHAEGLENISEGNASHAEGQYNVAVGGQSHAEGGGLFITEHLNGLDITGDAGSKKYVADKFPYQFHIGANITYNGITRKIINKGFVGRRYSITLDDTLDQDNNVVISSLDIDYLHGAFGECSHVEGFSTTAYNVCEHAEGQYNVSHAKIDYDNYYTMHSVGIGYVDDYGQIFYRNAFEILSNGYIYAYNVGNYDGANINDADSLQDVINGFATEQYVDNAIADLVNSAPDTLDTLNELATALGNDANFATTVATQIGTKVSKDELSAQAYLQSESDPIFTASAAHRITSKDINTWNGLVSNVQGDWYVNDSRVESYIYFKPPIYHYFVNEAIDNTLTASTQNYSIQQESAHIAYGDASFAENQSLTIGNYSHSEGLIDILYTITSDKIMCDWSTGTYIEMPYATNYFFLSYIYMTFTQRNIPIYVLVVINDIKGSKGSRMLLRQITGVDSDSTEFCYLHFDQPFGYAGVGVVDIFTIHIVSFGAIGEASHSEGYNTMALGAYSHSEGIHTVAFHTASHVCGTYNYYSPDIRDVFTVGVGGNNSTKINGFSILKDGSSYLVNVGGFDGTNYNSSIPLQDVVNSKVSKDELSAQGYVSGPMTTTDYGYAKLGTNTTLTINNTNKVYPIGMTSSGELAVNVPWVSGSGGGGESVQSDWEEDDNTETSYILNKPPVGNSKIFYGTCDTEAATTTKVVTCTDFTADDLVEGVIMLVKFSETNSGAVASLTLKINDIAASEASIKKMYASTSSNATINNLTQVKEIAANAILPFIYTGTYWLVAGLDMNVNSTYSAMSVDEGKAGTATSARSMYAARLKEIITYFIGENKSDWNETDDTSASYILNKPTIPVEVTESTVSGWGFTKNTGTLTGVKFNNTNATVSDGVASITATIPPEVTESTVSGWGFTKNAGTLTEHAQHKLNIATGTTTANSGNSITFIESLTGTTTATSDDLTLTPTKKTITIPSAANNSTITIQKSGTTVDSFTTNASSNKTINIPNELPAYSSSDSGKVLSVNSSGQLVWISPAIIYSGSDAPNNSQGNNGDIYLQM